MTSVGQEGATARDERACEVCGHPLIVQRLARACLLLKCPRCGHLMRDLHLCPAGARDRVYGGSEQFDRFRLFFTQRRLATLRSQLPVKRQPHVLEVGFGDGRLLSSFQRSGCQVYGVEVYRPEGPRIDALRAHGARLFTDGLEKADLPHETLDLIYMIHVAEHLPDTLNSFRKLSAVSRKGGLLYLVTPNGCSAGLRIFRDRWWHLEDPTHRQFFTPQSVMACLQAAGFQPLGMKALMMDSLTLEINSLMRLFYRRGVVMDHLVVRALDILLLPMAVLSRSLWAQIRPNMEVLARKA